MRGSGKNKVDLFPAIPSPCKGCERRTTGCHSVCKDYADFGKRLDELKKTIKKEDDEYRAYKAVVRRNRKKGNYVY